MATTIHQPPRTEEVRNPSRLTGGPGGGWRGPGSGDGTRLALREYSPPPASTGIWVLMAAISMTFLAFTSALVVRKGGDINWQHFTLPSILYFNTLVLLVSSITLQVARYRVAACMQAQGVAVQAALRWLYITLSLGVLFVLGQYLAWRQLRADGLYLATNPGSSFFYVFTVAHALHLMGGLIALTLVIYKLRHLALRRSTLDATARYWHFMDFLWVYLLVLLWIKL